jgi:hypothetical protein
MRFPQLQNRAFAFTLMFLIVASNSAVPTARPKKPVRKAAHVVLSTNNVELLPGAIVEIKARILDSHDKEISNASVNWKFGTDTNGMVQLRTLNNSGTDILLTGTSKSAIAKTFKLSAQSGTAIAEVNVTLPASEPAKIILEPAEVDLSVGATQTIKASVNDSHGNLIPSSEVTWRVLPQSMEAFVYVGQSKTEQGTHLVDIVGRQGPPNLQPLSEIRLVARSGNAERELPIKFKKPPADDYTINFVDTKSLDLQPGGTSTVKVEVREKNGALLPDVPITASVVNDDLAKLVKVVGPDNDNVFTLVAIYDDTKGGPKTEALIRGALTVRSGVIVNTLPLSYRRNPVITSWEILPPSIVGDNYGRTVKNDYYCIEVMIQNNSGSDIALAGLIFDVDERERPVTSYSTVHGSLAKRKLTHPRALTLAIVDGVGSLMTGFNPFFHNDSHAANYSQIIDILSNPFAKGLASVWKDSYPEEVSRFEQDVLKDDKIVSNGSTFKTKIFFPKRALFENGDPNRDNFEVIRSKLGNLVVLGYRLQSPLERLSH